VPDDGDLIGLVGFGNVIVARLVPRASSIRFWADDETIASGTCTWLNWEVENVREVYLDGDGVVGRDRRQVCPTTSTSYQLKAILLDGSVSAHTVEISVVTP
jgi:hypothetical protein